jgi:glycosyltransferase involved in cell wall biosynthesis
MDGSLAWQLVIMAPSKILFVVNTLRVGGFERDVATLCQHIDLNRFQPEVWVLIGGGEYEAQVHASGVKLRNLGRKWARSPLFAWKAAREFSRCDADVIHAFLPSIASYMALARMWFGVRQPMVLSIGQSHASRRDGWMFRWCSRKFDWLVANSRSAEELGRSLGFSPERISVIPNGHEIDRYAGNVDRDTIRARVGVQPHEPMLLCVGRLVDTKRVSDAVAALDLLGDSSRAKLVIVGDGPERGALNNEVNRRGLQKKVVFTGQRTDVPELLRAADVFVFPSETEGLPNSLIEACLAGLPVVACDVPGVADVVKDGETAILVPPRHQTELAAAVRRVLTEPVVASRLAAAAQSLARNRYSIDQTLHGLYDVYDRLLNSQEHPKVGQVAAVD